MPFARFALTIRLTTIAALLTTVTLRGLAQQQPAGAAPEAPRVPLLGVTDYTRPVSHFPNPVGPYTARHLPPPNLANTPRMDSLMHDGKLYLSIDDAVALALENNLDIAIARYSLNIADTDVLRAKSGNSILGVNFGVVQNTPGGGVGGLGSSVGSGTGGTSVAPGGIGAGTAGLVTSTLGIGSPITSFDPIVTGSLQWDH